MKVGPGRYSIPKSVGACEAYETGAPKVQWVEDGSIPTGNKFELDLLRKVTMLENDLLVIARRIARRGGAPTESERDRIADLRKRLANVRAGKKDTGEDLDN